VASKSGIKFADMLQRSKNPLIAAAGSRLQNKSWQLEEEKKKKAAALMKGATRGFEEKRLGLAMGGALTHREQQALLEETAKKGSGFFGELLKKKTARKEAAEDSKDSFDKYHAALDDYKVAEGRLHEFTPARRELEQAQQDLQKYNKSKPKDDAKEEDKKRWNEGLKERQTKIADLKNKLAGQRTEKKDNADYKEILETFTEARKHKEEVTKERRTNMGKLFKSKKEEREKQSAYNDFVEHGLSKFDRNTRNQLADSGFRLERTSLPGGREARDKQIPELNAGKFKKEVDRLEKVFKERKESHDKKIADPFATAEEKALLKKDLDFAEKNYNTVNTQYKNFANAEKELQDAKLATDKVKSKDDPDFEKTWNRLRKAEKNYQETSVHNIYVKPAYKTGGKEEKIEEE
jgi:hypothetical protein